MLNTNKIAYFFLKIIKKNVKVLRILNVSSKMFETNFFQKVYVGVPIMFTIKTPVMI